jgi:hypothetical protein
MIIFSQLANPSSVLANIKTRDLYMWFNLLYKAMSPSQVDDTTSLVWTETLIMHEPQARELLVLQSILLSQGQFIYHDNALYISNYYFYFIKP